MRKVIVGFILLAVLIAVVAVNFRFWDVDRYRPDLVRLLNEKTPYQWNIESIGLGWKGGPVLDVRQIQVQADLPEANVTAAVGHVLAHVDWRPLLDKHIHIRRLIIEQPEAVVNVRSPLPAEAQKTPALAAAPVALAEEAAGVIKEKSAASQSSNIRFQIDNLSLSQGAVDVRGVLPNDEVLLFRQFEAQLDGLAPGETVSIAMSTQSNSNESWSIRGDVRLDADGRPSALHHASVRLDNIRTQVWMPPKNDQDPYLHARVNVQWQGNLPSLVPERILRAAEGAGTFELTDPVIMRLHVLRSVFEQIPLLGQYADKVAGRMPEHQTYWRSNRTRFESLETPFTLRDGKLTVPEISLVNEAFQFTLTDTVYDWDRLRASGKLNVTPEFTQAALLDSIKEAVYVLVNDKGEMEVPVKIRYPEKPPVMPVVENLMQRAVSGLVGALLERVTEPDAPAPESTEPQPQPLQPAGQTETPRRPPSTEALVGEALKLLLQGQ